MTIAICAVGSVLSACGRNETNQLWKPSLFRPAPSLPVAAPNSAVPVFPAIGSFAFGIYAWPMVTTRRADSRRRRRFSCVTSSLRIICGAGLATTVPWLSTTCFSRCGCQSVPPLATDAYASAVGHGRVRVQKLHRGDRDEALPDGLLVRVADRPRLVLVLELPLGTR